VLYKSNRKPYQPSLGKATKRLTDLEADFAI
jgi:hypothetical protein